MTDQESTEYEINVVEGTHTLEPSPRKKTAADGSQSPMLDYGTFSPWAQSKDGESRDRIKSDALTPRQLGEDDSPAAAHETAQHTPPSSLIGGNTQGWSHISLNSTTPSTPENSAKRRYTFAARGGSRPSPPARLPLLMSPTATRRSIHLAVTPPPRSSSRSAALDLRDNVYRGSSGLMPSGAFTFATEAHRIANCASVDRPQTQATAQVAATAPASSVTDMRSCESPPRRSQRPAPPDVRSPTHRAAKSGGSPTLRSPRRYDSPPKPSHQFDPIAGSSRSALCLPMETAELSKRAAAPTSSVPGLGGMMSSLLLVTSNAFATPPRASRSTTATESTASRTKHASQEARVSSPSKRKPSSSSSSGSPRSAKGPRTRVDGPLPNKAALALGPAFGDELPAGPSTQYASPTAKIADPSSIIKSVSSAQQIRHPPIERPVRRKSKRGWTGLNILGIEHEIEVALCEDSPPVLAAPTADSNSTPPAQLVPSIVITPPPMIQTPARSLTGSLARLSTGSPAAGPASPKRGYTGAVLSFASPDSMQEQRVPMGANPSYDAFASPLPPSPPSPVYTEASASTLVDSPTSISTSASSLAGATPLAALETRMAADELAFEELSTEIDWVLSEYLQLRSPAQSWSLARRVVALVEGAIKGGMGVASPPSLRKHSGDGDKAISAEWEATEYEKIMERLLNHVISGIACLLADRRAPYECPQALARMCSVIQWRLSGPGSPKDRSTPDNAASTPAFAHGSPVATRRRGSGAEVPNAPSSPASTVCSEVSSSNRDRLDPGSMFMRLLLQELSTAFARGEVVRNRSLHLEVPAARQRSKRKQAAFEAERAAAGAQREKSIALVARGVMSEQTYRQEERTRAAQGDAKDEFVSIDMVRFVGELYRIGLVEPSVVERWLNRLLFETVFPGLPSVFELECACALLITVGGPLEDAATEQEKSTERSPSEKSLGTPTTPARGNVAGILQTPPTMPLRADVPAYHWINHSPSSARCSPHKSHAGIVSPPGTLVGLHTAKGDAEVDVRMVLEGVMDRLEELTEITDVDTDAKMWIQEVIAMRRRNWRPLDVEDEPSSEDGRVTLF